MVIILKIIFYNYTQTIKYLESSGDSGKLDDIANGVGEFGCK